MLDEEEFILGYLDVIKNNALKIFNITNFNICLESCKELKKMDMPKPEKKRLAYTHYTFYLIKMELLLDDSHQCKIFVENGELVIGDNRIAPYDIDFLEHLCDAESISFDSEQSRDVTEINISVKNNLNQQTAKKRRFLKKENR